MEKLLARIETDPVLPVWWGKNQSGMQAREELSEDARVRAEDCWREAVLSGVQYARRLGEMGLHKQVANRAAELGMFIVVVVTATEFDNFFALRDHPDAQPELADVAGKAHRLWSGSEPQRLAAGSWHLPYVTGFDSKEFIEASGVDAVCRMSIGRCAAVSYLNQGKRDPPADIARADKLAAAGHMSPFEHVAEALTQEEWQSYAYISVERWVHRRVPVGNLWGWRQYRKGLYSEHDFSRQL